MFWDGFGTPWWRHLQPRPARLSEDDSIQIVPRWQNLAFAWVHEEWHAGTNNMPCWDDRRRLRNWLEDTGRHNSWRYLGDLPRRLFQTMRITLNRTLWLIGSQWRLSLACTEGLPWHKWMHDLCTQYMAMALKHYSDRKGWSWLRKMILKGCG